MDFDSYVKNGLVEKVNVDKKISKNVYELARKKIAVQPYIPLNEEHSEVKFVLFFDCVTQLIDSIALEKGYKINFVDGYSIFLKDVLKESVLSNRMSLLIGTYKSMKFQGERISTVKFADLLSNIMEIISFIGDKYFNRQ